MFLETLLARPGFLNDDKTTEGEHASALARSPLPLSKPP